MHITYNDGFEWSKYGNISLAAITGKDIESVSWESETAKLFLLAIQPPLFHCILRFTFFKRNTKIAKYEFKVSFDRLVCSQTQSYHLFHLW